MTAALIALQAGDTARARDIAQAILASQPSHRGARHLVLMVDHGIRMPFTAIYLHEEGKYTIGDFAYGVPKLLAFYFQEHLTIGRFSALADNVSIFLSGNHRIDQITGYGFAASNYGTLFTDTPDDTTLTASNGPVVIGNDVWIGRESTIMTGVTIGDGAVVAACSVVNRDVAPYEVVGGNPVKRVRWRFEPEIIELLMRVRWWDWSLEKIKQHAKLLNSRDFSALETLMSS